MIAPDVFSTLREARTVAVIGASARIHRPSYHAVELLKDAGYAVVPVNPKYDVVLGETCYADLSEVPDSIAIDILNVFRRPDAVPDLLEAVAERIERTGETITLWTQFGVSSSLSAERARELGLPHVRNTCIMIELERHRKSLFNRPSRRGA